jgi:hypothetical protein
MDTLPMCALSFALVFATAHIVAWSAMGGGWPGAARAPFAVFLPAAALIGIDGVINDALADAWAKIGTLLAWELAYFFLYLCLRLGWRSVEPAQLAGPRR